jgi:hypothetical protein
MATVIIIRRKDEEWNVDDGMEHFDLADVLQQGWLEVSAGLDDGTGARETVLQCSGR